MQFSNNLVTELIIPTGTPFAPGYDVIGIGAAAPPELAAAGFTIGMIIYNSAWNPSLTTPQVKYIFLGTLAQAGSGAEFFIGFAVAPNAAANPNNVLLNNGLSLETLNRTGVTTASGMVSQLQIDNGNGQGIALIAETVAGTGNGQVAAQNNGSTPSGGTTHSILIGP
jgi:hypothetical protein